jgi:excisionase family DNA binding protein
MEKMVTKADAAKLVGVSVKTIERWIGEGKIKAYRLGPRLVRIDEGSVLNVYERILPSNNEVN